MPTDTVDFTISAHGTQEISCIWLFGHVLRKENWNVSSQIYSWIGMGCVGWGENGFQNNLPTFCEEATEKLNS